MVSKMNKRSHPFMSRRHDTGAHMLIEDAEAAIIRKGYDRVTMRDIAAEAGCAPGTLYRYFKNKREVVNAIVTRHSGRLHSAIGEALSSSSAPLEKLRRATETSVEYFNENRNFFRMFFTATSGKPDRVMSDLPARVQRDWRELRELMLEVIREAQARGQVRRDYSPESIRKFMHGLMTGYLDELSVQEALPHRREQVRTLWGFMTGGISGAEGRDA